MRRSALSDVSFVVGTKTVQIPIQCTTLGLAMQSLRRIASTRPPPSSIQNQNISCSVLCFVFALRSGGRFCGRSERELISPSCCCWRVSRCGDRNTHATRTAHTVARRTYAPHRRTQAAQAVSANARRAFLKPICAHRLAAWV